MSEIPIIPNVDAAATRDAYANFSPWRCTCAFCRNVRTQWDNWLSEEVNRMLTSAGIDPTKPNEIVDFGKSPCGRTVQVEWIFLRPKHQIGNCHEQIAIGPIGKVQIFIYRDGIPSE